MSSVPNRPLDLKHLLVVLRGRAWLVLLLVLVASTGAYALARQAPNRYEATSKVRILDSNVSNPFLNSQSGTDSSRQVDSEIAVLSSNDLRAAVDQRLATRSALIDKVSVSSLENSDVLVIGVVSTSRTLARDAANAYADIYVAKRKASAVKVLVQNSKELRAKADELGRSIAFLDAQIANNAGAQGDDARARRYGLEAQREDLNSRATQFDVQAAVLSGNVEIVDRARLPSAPISPTPRVNAEIAAAVALLLGIALALVLDLLDDRIISGENLEAVTGGLPLLGSIPIYRAKGKRGARKLPHGPRTLVPLHTMEAEVYRTIRTNLQFTNLDKTKSVIVITSSSSSEGKSTVTANLAVAMAEGGQRVIVVSGDLRRPALAGIFGVDETAAGLTTVLLGDSTLSECLVPIDLASGHRLFVLPAGPLPPNPAELLGSRAMGELISEMSRADVDFVLVDCPPVLPVSDPLAIAQFADGVILLSVVGQTRAHHLREACDRFNRVGADLIGVLLNGVPTAGSRYPYHYDRRYSRYRAYEPSVPEAAGKRGVKLPGRHGQNGDRNGIVTVGTTETDKQ